jgi:hypothetical protein
VAEEGRERVGRRVARAHPRGAWSGAPALASRA